jgi:hypothetical protein
MFKEPISWLYRDRGKPARIKKAGKRWPKGYEMMSSDVLKVKPSKIFDPMRFAIPMSEWMSKN